MDDLLWAFLSEAGRDECSEVMLEEDADEGGESSLVGLIGGVPADKVSGNASGVGVVLDFELLGLAGEDLVADDAAGLVEGDTPLVPLGSLFLAFELAGTLSLLAPPGVNTLTCSPVPSF